VRSAILFVVLAGVGLAGLWAFSGGFVAEAPPGEIPAVDTPRERAGPVFDPSSLDSTHRLPPLGIGKSKRASFPATEHRTFVDRVTGEKIEFPRFVTWTFHAGEAEPRPDPVTGEQHVLCRDVRVRMYREPATREEAVALRDDAKTFERLVRLEVEAEEGQADFLLAAPAPDAPPATDVRSILHLTKSVRIADVQQGIVIRTTDVTVDAKAGTAEGNADIVADLPAGVMHGRGFRLDQKHDVLEILDRADLDLKSSEGSAWTGSPFDLGEGTPRRTRVRAEGGAVVTRDPVAHGAPAHFTVRLSQRVHVEQVDGQSLDADVVEIEVVKRLATAEKAPAMSEGNPPAEGAVAKAYRFQRLRADGNVVMEQPQGGTAGGSPGLLSLAARRLVYTMTGDGDGASVLEGEPSLRWTGEFSMTGDKPGRGTIRARCAERMSFGPPAEGRGEGNVALMLQASAVVERDDPAHPGEADRLEAERIDLALASRAPTTDVVRPAASPRGRRGDMAVVAFKAAGAVRLSGPSIRGSAELIVGQDLDRPDERHVFAQGPDTEFEIAGLATGASDAPKAPAPAPASMAGDGKPAAGTPAEKKAWRIEAIDARKGVRGRAQALAAAGDEPLLMEGGVLTYRRASGGRLVGEEGGLARVTMPRAGGGSPSWMTAPAIAFGADGRVDTEGKTHAEMWSGGKTAAGRASARPAADVLAIHSGSRIDLFGVQRPDADAIVRIEDGGRIEVRAKAQVLDRLEAGTIEIALAERPVEAEGGLFGLGGSVARPAKASSTTERETPATAPPRDDPPSLTVLDCRKRLHVDTRSDGAGGGASTALGGVRGLRAEGTVVAVLGDRSFSGDVLDFDGTTGVMRLLGREGTPAHVRLGEGPLAQRFTSPEVEVTTREGKPDQITFRAPMSAALHRADPAAKGVLERYEMVSQGDFTIGAEQAVAEHGVAVRRTIRRGAAGAFGEAAILQAPKLVLEALAGGSLLASQGAPGFGRMVASGEGTRFDLGEPGKSTSASGDRIVFDAVASTVTITGTPRAHLRREGGPTGLNKLDGKKYVFFLRTGLWDFEGTRWEFGGK
jgi:hypothetical protein